MSYTGVPTVSGSRVYLYPMNFRAEDFVNNSPNFTNISFKLNGDGTFFIKKTCEEVPPTIIAPVQIASKFGLSSFARNVRVSNAAVGHRFAVLDMQGKVIRSGIVNSANFEVPVANAGIYMVRVGSVTQRIRIK